MLISEGLPFSSGYLSTRIQVTLIAYQHDDHVWVSILLHFFEPAGQVAERVSSRDVVDQKRPSRPTIVRPRDALERLLAGCVPNLQLNVLLEYLNSPGTKLHANCQIVLLSKPFVCELEEET